MTYHSLKKLVEMYGHSGMFSKNGKKKLGKKIIFSRQ